MLISRFPVHVTAPSPLRQILLVDGPAAKLGGQNLLDFGKGVQPVEQWLAWLAIPEPPVQFFTNGPR